MIFNKIYTKLLFGSMKTKKILEKDISIKLKLKQKTNGIFFQYFIPL